MDLITLIVGLIAINASDLFENKNGNISYLVGFIAGIALSIFILTR